MDSGATWAIIVALASTLAGFTGAVLRYLLSEIRDLKKALVEANTSTAAANEVNATLAMLWIKEQQKQRDSA